MGVHKGCGGLVHPHGAVLACQRGDVVLLVVHQSARRVPVSGGVRVTNRESIEKNVALEAIATPEGVWANGTGFFRPLFVIGYPESCFFGPKAGVIPRVDKEPPVLDKISEECPPSKLRLPLVRSPKDMTAAGRRVGQ